MKTVLKRMAVLSLWVVARLGRMDKYDRDYDWRTIDGWLRSPLLPAAYVYGCVCWLVLLAGIGLLLWWQFRSI